MARLSPGRKDAAPSRDGSRVRLNSGKKAALHNALRCPDFWLCAVRSVHMFG
jgi:hypothetical protein